MEQGAVTGGSIYQTAIRVLAFFFFWEVFSHWLRFLCLISPFCFWRVGCIPKAPVLPKLCKHWTNGYNTVLSEGFVLTDLRISCGRDSCGTSHNRARTIIVPASPLCEEMLFVFVFFPRIISCFAEISVRNSFGEFVDKL